MDRPEDQPVTSRVNIGGHPIHPMIVPLPLVTLVGAFVTDLVYLVGGGDPFWVRASFYLLAAGVVSGLVAGVVGLVDFIGIPRVRALSAGWLHLGFNLGAVVLSLVNLLLRLPNPVLTSSTLGAGIILSAIVTGLLVFSGWWGGELVYRHRVAVVEKRDGAAGARGSDEQPAAKPRPLA